MANFAARSKGTRIVHLSVIASISANLFISSYIEGRTWRLGTTVYIYSSLLFTDTDEKTVVHLQRVSYKYPVRAKLIYEELIS